MMVELTHLGIPLQTAVVPLASSSQVRDNKWFKETAHLFSLKPAVAGTSADPASPLVASAIPSWTTAARLARAYEHLPPEHQAQIPVVILEELLADVLAHKKSRGSQRTWLTANKLLRAIQSQNSPVKQELQHQVVAVGLEYHAKVLRAKGTSGVQLDQARSLIQRAVDGLVQAPRHRLLASVVPKGAPDPRFLQDLLWCLSANLGQRPTSATLLFRLLRTLLLYIHQGDAQSLQSNTIPLVDSVLLRLSETTSKTNALRIWQLLSFLQKDLSHDNAASIRPLRAGLRLLMHYVHQQDTLLSTLQPENQQPSLLTPPLHPCSIPHIDQLLQHLLPSLPPQSSIGTPLTIGLILLVDGEKSPCLYHALVRILTSNSRHPLSQQRLFQLAAFLSPDRRPRLFPQQTLAIAALFTAASQSEHFLVAKNLFLVLRNAHANQTDTRWKSTLRLFSPQQGSSPIVWLFNKSLTKKMSGRDAYLPLMLFQDFAYELGSSVSPDVSATFWKLAGSQGRPDWIARILRGLSRPLNATEAVALMTGALSTHRILVALRSLRLVRDNAPSVSFTLQEVWNPLLHLIAQTHSRRVRLFQHVFRNMGQLPDEDTILAVLRLYSRRWDLSTDDVRKLQRHKREMVERYSVQPDDRHQAEVIYALVRRGRQRLAEALVLFMDLTHPSLVSSDIVGLLIIRLADSNMYDEAARAAAKWTSEVPLDKQTAKQLRVVRDEGTVAVASLYTAAKRAGLESLDPLMLRRMGVQRPDTEAIKRLNSKLQAASAL